MADFSTLLSARLENLRPSPHGGWTARCPICALSGGDTTTKSHLRIFRNGAFACAAHNKAGCAEPIDHNRQIRAFIYQGLDGVQLSELDIQVIDPEPKLLDDKVYPEDSLAKLVPDYTYWINRGISDTVLKKLEGGMSPPDEKNKLSGRFVFPIRDDKGRIVGFTGRLVSDASFGPKHKHLVKASRAVYPYAIAAPAVRATQKVVLVESIGDLLSCLTVGMDYVIMLFGLNLNSRVLGLLVSANVQHIIICTNNDPGKVNKVTGRLEKPGNEAAVKIQTRLLPFFGEEKLYIHLPQTRKDLNLILMDKTGEMEEFKKWVEAL